MPKQRVNPDSLFPSLKYGFSQIVVATGRRTVYISGQTARDGAEPSSGAGGRAQQARQALRNVRTAVEAAGGTHGDRVSLRISMVGYHPEKPSASGGALRDVRPEPGRPA